MPPVLGEIRRSQLVTTFGVGAIVAIGDESFMICGLDDWPVTVPDLHEPRLERSLGVSGFARPPAGETGLDIPVVRFPDIVWCPGCKRLAKHDHFAGRTGNKCMDCGVGLVPSRFVVVCENGHIDSFPYFNWVHAGGKQSAARTHELRIEAGGNTASLRDIQVSCSCGRSRTMEGAFGKFALRGVRGCSGRRPWLNTNDEQCVSLPRTLQRGASNVWFALAHSAISIPPWSEGAFKLLNKYWHVLQHVPEESLRSTLTGMHILPQDSPYNIDDLILAVSQRRRAGADDLDRGVDLRVQEFEALVRGKKEVSRDQDFVCEPAVSIPGAVAGWIETVMLVKRLREVRALETFSRLNPPSRRPGQMSPPIFERRTGWLPAIDVIGEGVFLRLREDRLQSWESRLDVRKRIERVARTYTARGELHRTITPRLMLIHSLAHALIGQWALNSGYPAASLRERLYVAKHMAGLLIYTASSDSAGSLGGVIAQAEPAHLEAALHECILRASWCSTDPVCIETDAGGVDALNIAACHACLLLPEVSCEEQNGLLDRGLLVGTPRAPDIGYFAQLLGNNY
jgi:hypothetical protein